MSLPEKRRSFTSHEEISVLSCSHFEIIHDPKLYSTIATTSSVFKLFTPENQEKSTPQQWPSYHQTCVQVTWLCEKEAPGPGRHQQKQGIKGGQKMLPWRSWYNLTTSNIISNQVYKIHCHECWGYFRVGFSSETLPSTAICGRETSRVKKCAWSQWAAAAVQVQNFRTVFFLQKKEREEKKTAESHPTKYWLRVIIQIDKKNNFIL